MEDVHVTVHHRAHWEWVIPRDGVQEHEEYIQPNPDHPEWVRVKRLVPENSYTELIIPGESAQRMADEHAAVRGADATTPQHLHAALARHIEDTMHRDHAPTHHWHHVEVRGAQHEALQTHLHNHFIGTPQ